VLEVNGPNTWVVFERNCDGDRDNFESYDAVLVDWISLIGACMICALRDSPSCRSEIIWLGSDTANLKNRPKRRGLLMIVRWGKSRTWQFLIATGFSLSTVFAQMTFG
jgi:hypothetical protein